MSLISQCFKNLNTDNKTALIPYITAGDPVPCMTLPLMHAFVEAGADILELGIPFSDPISDGPVIQKACERALKNDVNLTCVLKMVKNFRKNNTYTPVVLMGYINPIESMGYESFAKNSKQVGVDGVLIIDMPPEESDEYVCMMQKNSIDTIFLVSPTTSKERMIKIAKYTKGFIYYVAIKGVTGVSALNIASVKNQLKILRNCTDLPISVGFGINNFELAAKISEVADAVVVGSALVRCIADNLDRPENLVIAAADLLAKMSHAINTRNIFK